MTKARATGTTGGADGTTLASELSNPSTPQAGE